MPQGDGPKVGAGVPVPVEDKLVVQRDAYLGGGEGGAASVVA